MREILFKAKRLDNGEWVEGDLVHSVYKINDTCIGKYGSNIGMHQVDHNTICQYTGLTDKNGKKIWENDVVDIQHYATKAHKVKWGYGGFYVGINGLLCHYNTVCEVIGNIFDSPELLEGGGEDE